MHSFAGFKSTPLSVWLARTFATSVASQRMCTFSQANKRSNTMMKTCVLLAILGLASAACPNACSGNGVCGANDKCSCYQNFQGADCSLRTCTFTLAWADTADGTNQAHYYAECGNKGVCDRKTGECKCFDGYEGKGCRRSTCPDACSGHGTCEYIEELASDYQDRRYGPGNRFQDLSCGDSTSARPGNNRDACKVTGSKEGALTISVVAATASSNLDLAALANLATDINVGAALYNAVETGDRWSTPPPERLSPPLVPTPISGSSRVPPPTPSPSLVPMPMLLPAPSLTSAVVVMALPTPIS